MFSTVIRTAYVSKRFARCALECSVEQKRDFERSVRRDWVATRVSGGSEGPLLDGFECLIRQTARQTPNESDSRNRTVSQNLGAHDNRSLHFRFYRIVRKARAQAPRTLYPSTAFQRSVVQNGLLVCYRRMFGVHPDTPLMSRDIRRINRRSFFCSKIHHFKAHWNDSRFAENHCPSLRRPDRYVYDCTIRSDPHRALNEHRGVQF